MLPFGKKKDRYVSIERGLSAAVSDGSPESVKMPEDTNNSRQQFRDTDDILVPFPSVQYEPKISKSSRGTSNGIAQQEKVLRDLVTTCMKTGTARPHSTEHRHMCRKAVTAASAFRDGPKLFLSLVKDVVRESIDSKSKLPAILALLDEVFWSGSFHLKLKIGSGKELLGILGRQALRSTFEPTQKLIATSIFAWVKIVESELDLFPALQETSTQLFDAKLDRLLDENMATTAEKITEQASLEIEERLNCITQTATLAMAIIDGTREWPKPRCTDDLTNNGTLQHLLSKLHNEAEFLRTRIQTTAKSRRAFQLLIKANEAVMKSLEAYGNALKTLPKELTIAKARRSVIIMKTEKAESIIEPSVRPNVGMESIKSQQIGNLAERLGRRDKEIMASRQQQDEITKSKVQQTAEEEGYSIAPKSRKHKKKVKNKIEKDSGELSVLRRSFDVPSLTEDYVPQFSQSVAPDAANRSMLRRHSEPLTMPMMATRQPTKLAQVAPLSQLRPQFLPTSYTSSSLDLRRLGSYPSCSTPSVSTWLSGSNTFSRPIATTFRPPGLDVWQQPPFRPKMPSVSYGSQFSSNTWPSNYAQPKQ